LLLCHGVSGTLHQASSWPVGPEEGHSAFLTKLAASEKHHGDHQGENEGTLATSSCAVSVSVVFLGTALVVLLGGALLQKVAVVAARMAGRDFSPDIFRPPRGAASPLLQVFRL